MNKELANKIVTEAMEHDTKNFGVPYGQDFAEFAAEMWQSRQFQNFCKVSVATGALGMMAINPEKLGDIEAMIKESPITRNVLVAFYMGYKLGWASKEEVDQSLSRMEMKQPGDP